MDGSRARWEWRTFGSSFGEVDRLFAEIGPAAIQESEEVYLVSSTLDKSTKVRAGLLDIKSLEQVNQAGLEQWRPVIKASLPLSISDTYRVGAILGAAVPASISEGYGLDQLLEELSRGGHEMLTVPVHKKRLRYTLGGCMVEMTQVRVRLRESRTLAIESEDPEKVISLVRDLGLSDLPNNSYPRWLWATVRSES